MGLLVIIITTFLMLVGTFTLINELSERGQKPEVWLRFSRQRRTLLILGLGFILAPIRGAYLWMKKENKKRAIDFLMELEVKLAQIASLLNNIIASKESGAPVELLDMLAEYLVVYGIRNRGPDDKGMTILAPDWHTDLGETNGTMVKASFDDLSDAISRWANLGEGKMNDRQLYELVSKVDNTKTMLKVLVNEYRE